MLEIWWVRHGTTDWNTIKRWQGHTDLPLNENGRSLARLLAPRLADIPFDECWSSDLQRSAETARLALPGREIRLDARLRELHMGALEGRTWNEMRVHAWQSERPKEGRIIAFTHGGVIRCCLWDIFGMPTPEHNWTIELDNTGIVRIRYTEDCATLVCFNDVSHIKDNWNRPPAQSLPSG